MYSPEMPALVLVPPLLPAKASVEGYFMRPFFAISQGYSREWPRCSLAVVGFRAGLFLRHDSAMEWFSYGGVAIRLMNYFRWCGTEPLVRVAHIQY